LTEYKHHAPKTSYEIWFLDNVTTHVEKLIPSNWTANAVTVVGNLACPIAGMICIYNAGVQYHTDEKDLEPRILPSWAFFMAAFAAQWFSWGDAIDG
jgi:hypothetical protein